MEFPLRNTYPRYRKSAAQKALRALTGNHATSNVISDEGDETSNLSRLGLALPMIRLINRHHRLLVIRDNLRRRSERGSVWAPRALTMRAALLAARIAERWTWRRLVCRGASNAFEAEQKALYLMAAVIAQRKSIKRQEIATAARTVRQFRHQLADLLGIAGTHDPL
ncbi:hypothetical protein RFM99_29185 [Mesorhizobium sp. VK4C]|uniref:hypothetical protein n=1 Tax=Mesorhizobium captivum TaxID=3072319 RepID=UPI002A242D62|nr:hypothetical protein [Mesorhizobium sp. VK4C]MDX8502461.1 hypothetical protein [Mesorhizobium sp. VK4C]